MTNISDFEAFEMNILDTQAEDYEKNNDEIIVWSAPNSLADVKKSLENFGYEIMESGFAYRAKNFTPVTDFDNVLKLYKMFDAFEEDEDVEITWNNADIDDKLWNEAEEFAESKKFRT